MITIKYRAYFYKEYKKLMRPNNMKLTVEVTIDDEDDYISWKGAKSDQQAFGIWYNNKLWRVKQEGRNELLDDMCRAIRNLAK